MLQLVTQTVSQQGGYTVVVDVLYIAPEIVVQKLGRVDTGVLIEPGPGNLQPSNTHLLPGSIAEGIV